MRHLVTAFGLPGVLCGLAHYSNLAGIKIHHHAKWGSGAPLAGLAMAHDAGSITIDRGSQLSALAACIHAPHVGYSPDVEKGPPR